MAVRDSTQPKSSFLVLITGEIEYAELHTVDNIYCKYFYVYGSDWRQISGLEEGISPTAQKGKNSPKIILNTPLEATFSSTNPFKWPQIVVCCYGHDSFGNDVIRGYGATYIPTISGRSKRTFPIFIPEASTVMHKIIGFFTGRRAEFVDPRIVAMAEGRDVTRVRTQGFVTITFNTVLKDLKKFGYDNQPHTLSKPSEFPLSTFQESFDQRTPPPALIQSTSSAPIIIETTINEPEEFDSEPTIQRTHVETIQADDQVIEEIEEIKED